MTRQRGRRRGERLRQAGLPFLWLAGVGALDLVRTARQWPVPVDGALDEPAHATTAALLLAAAPRRPLPQLAAWALVGSVAIDIDHVPLYAGLLPSAVPGGRPVTHCLLTPVALAAAAAAARGRVRSALGGLALGVCLHFVRDVATGGTGVPLLWPVVPHSNVRVPYALYQAVLVAAAGVVAVRLGAARPGAGAAGR